jgi:hypothetical protein
MTRRAVLASLAAMFVVTLAIPVAAMDTRAGPAARVPAGETVDDDLYLAGSWVSMEGRVRGSVIAAGGTVSIRGPSDGDLLLAGGTIEASGQVGGAIRAVGGTVAVRGTVDRDVIAAGGRISFEPGARVGRDLAAAGGTVMVLGAVGRHARLAGGYVEIGGAIAGDVVIRASEIRVLPTAAIGGNLTYSSERPIVISDGARVVGRVTQEPYPVPPTPPRQVVRGLRIAFGIADFFWMLIIGLVLAAAMPGALRETAGTIRTRPWAALGWGILLLIAVPVAVVMLMVTIIGIPVAVLLTVVHVLVLFASHAAAGLAVGRFVAPRLESPFAEVALGIGIIAVATNLPVIGWALRLVAVAIGFGGIALALAGRRTGGTPPAPMPVGPAVA